MARLAAGHGAALNNLMERHAGEAFHYLVRSLQNEEDAADLAQETLPAFINIGRSSIRARNFTTWLYAIASNLVRDRYRWRKRHPQVSLDAPNEAGGNDFAGFAYRAEPLARKPRRSGSGAKRCAKPWPGFRRHCAFR